MRTLQAFPSGEGARPSPWSGVNPGGGGESPGYHRGARGGCPPGQATERVAGGTAGWEEFRAQGVEDHVGEGEGRGVGSRAGGVLRVVRKGKRERDTREKQAGIRSGLDPEAEGKRSHRSIFPTQQAKSFNPGLPLSIRHSEVRRSALPKRAAAPALPRGLAPFRGGSGRERTHVLPPGVCGALLSPVAWKTLPFFLLPRVLAPDQIRGFSVPSARTALYPSAARLTSGPATRPATTNPTRDPQPVHSDPPPSALICLLGLGRGKKGW